MMMMLPVIEARVYVDCSEELSRTADSGWFLKLGVWVAG
jgi:hypothetical protein